MKLEKNYADIAAYGEKYHFYHNADNGTIVCTTMYKGQMVRGVAKCSPDDNFDITTGKKLAYLRCKEKFMKKKSKRAHKAYEEAFVAESRAKNNLAKAIEFVDDTHHQLELAREELSNFEDELGIID